MMKSFRLSIAQQLSQLRFNVYLLLPIHVVFYCSLRFAPGCPASTLVISNKTSGIVKVGPGLARARPKHHELVYSIIRENLGNSNESFKEI